MGSSEQSSRDDGEGEKWQKWVGFEDTKASGAPGRLRETERWSIMAGSMEERGKGMRTQSERTREVGLGKGNGVNL